MQIENQESPEPQTLRIMPRFRPGITNYNPVKASPPPRPLQNGRVPLIGAARARRSQ